jgi:DnaJ-class molecular chaperone
MPAVPETMVDCPSCSGHGGEEWDDGDEMSGPQYRWHDCYRCYGVGKVAESSLTEEEK